MTKYPKSECEEHLDVKTDRPVCIICMMDEIDRLRGLLREVMEEDGDKFVMGTDWHDRASAALVPNA